MLVKKRQVRHLIKAFSVIVCAAKKTKSFLFLALAAKKYYRLTIKEKSY